MPLVVDASIALAWGLPDESSAYAEAVLAVVEREGMRVPEIWAREIRLDVARSKDSIMRSGKGKSRKASMKSHAEVRSAATLRHKRVPEISVSEITDRFCDEMIQNLRRNVSESKKKSRRAILS